MGKRGNNFAYARTQRNHPQNAVSGTPACRQAGLDDLVPHDNFYRRLNQVLDLHFLYQATAKYYGTEGQESIDPVVFFKICLVGYLNNINSDRKLIEYCSDSLAICLFLKYDIDDSVHKPLYDKMHQKMQTGYAKRLMRIRSKTVKPVLGTLMNFLNVRMVNTRGIAQANKHVLMAALTYNLKKYLNFIRKETIAQAVTLKEDLLKGIEMLIFGVLGRQISHRKFTEAIFQ